MNMETKSWRFSYFSAGDFIEEGSVVKNETGTFSPATGSTDLYDHCGSSGGIWRASYETEYEAFLFVANSALESHRLCVQFYLDRGEEHNLLDMEYDEFLLMNKNYQNKKYSGVFTVGNNKPFYITTCKENDLYVSRILSSDKEIVCFEANDQKPYIAFEKALVEMVRIVKSTTQGSENV